MFIGIVILIKCVSTTRVPSISVEHFLNGAQFLNTACVAALSGCFSFLGIGGLAARLVLRVIFSNSNISCD